MELIEFMAAVAQPLIVIAITGLIGVWINFSKKLSVAAETAQDALELAGRTAEAVSSLHESVDRLNATLHTIDIHNMKTEMKLAELEEEVKALRAHKHELANKLQINETRITILEQYPS